jgi:glutamine amidotransferase
LPRDSAFYFVHSFSARLVDDDALLAVTRHGNTEITAAVRKNNVIGTQFHPERSADAGRAFLKSFLQL